MYSEIQERKEKSTTENIRNNNDNTIASSVKQKHESKNILVSQLSHLSLTPPSQASTSSGDDPSCEFRVKNVDSETVEIPYKRVAKTHRRCTVCSVYDNDNKFITSITSI